MSRDYLTFQNYICNYNTQQTRKFKYYIGDSVIDKLPDKMCSSKVIYDIIHPELNTYVKQRVFRDTFMEYFKWKTMYY